MASKKKKVRKKFVPKHPGPAESRQYAEFMRSLVDGVVHAVRLYDSRVNGALQFEVDEEVDDV